MARRSKRNSNIIVDIPPPNDDTMISIAKIVLAEAETEPVPKKYAPVKHILARIGAGESVEPIHLPQYHPFYLKRTLKRLFRQKFIMQGGEGRYLLTDRGKRWLMKYRLENMEVAKPGKWDGKWRLVIYDVARHKSSLRNVFRITIKRLGFYNLQESVWVYPYPCEKEISFLREYCGMSGDVIYVIAHKIENDGAYRTHFGLS